MERLTKSRDRIRDHGEVFTPDFLVEDMLNLVDNETKRIESRFLEPACGNGNFLIKVLERKLDVVYKKYKKSQFDYEKNSLLAISSIYGIDLLNDNIEQAKNRLYNFFLEKYKKIYKKKINILFLESVKYILNRNIIQWDALSLKDKNDNPIIFSEWSFIWFKIKRRDFVFEEMIKKDKIEKNLFTEDPLISDDGKEAFIPKSIKRYTAINFLKLKEYYDK